MSRYNRSNTKAGAAQAILKRYAVESLIQPRDTMDLSPLEIWLLLRLIEAGYVPEPIDYPEPPKQIEGQTYEDF